MDKVIIICEHAPDFLIQGFGLSQGEGQSFVGKIGGHDVLLLPGTDGLQAEQVGGKIVYVGSTEADQSYRPGDVLMVGSDDLLDRAFKIMDEMEQRGVVVNLTPSQDATQLYLSKKQAEPLVQEWKDRKISFLCLWMVDLFESERIAQLLAILRKVLLKDK